MNKVILLILMLISVSGFGQGYTLQRAFPNLPDFFQPTELVNSGDGTNRLFLVQQDGLIYVFNNSPTVSTRKVFLDLTSRIITHPFNAILGMAFHPDYANNGYFYIQYAVDSIANPFGQFWVKVSRFSTSPTNPDSALLNSELNLLKINAPREHFGGKIEFGSDGYLYSAVGDGMFSSDSAQSKRSLLGKVLRINVDSASNGKNYSIPPSNPYYQNTQGYKEEIYALGFRNPFKFSFDTPTNRLFLGDVGAERYEEVDIVESGKNYGWNKMEGVICTPDSNNCDTSGRGFTPPILSYPHPHFSGGYTASVTGGYVYRGSLLPNLYGKYIYGDLVMGKIWALDSNINNELLFDTTFMIVSFGVDENKELYVVSFGWGEPAHIYNLVPRFPVGIEHISSETPDGFYLFQNFPNPFNPKTIINYQLSMFCYVQLKIYDVLGNEVAALVNENKNPGSYSVEFDGTDLSSGLYFYKIKAGNFEQIKKMILIK